MKTALREDEVIRFMTRAPQVHMMEIIGEYDFDPEEIELEEYVGRIDSAIGEDEALLVTTMSPVDGLRCIAAAGDVIGKVDLSCLSEEELEAYGSVNPHFTAPNVYRNDAATLIEDASWNEKCEECARRALSALFPDENVADVHADVHSIFGRDGLSGLVGSAMELADRYGHLADVMEKGTSLLDAAKKIRFKEYYSVTVGITIPDVGEVDGDGPMAAVTGYWKVMVDRNFEKVSTLRDSTERTAFLYSLGPEFYDLLEACMSFRRECQDILIEDDKVR